MSKYNELDLESFETQEKKVEAISQALFGKPASEIKYVLVTNHIHQILLDEDLTRTGLYQWLNVFRGHVKMPRDIINYNDYDIVQVNLATQDLHLLKDIRAELGEDSDTLLVANNDFTTELWSQSFPHPTLLADAIQHADFVFGTEYFQVTALSELLGREVFVIPHPADVKRLKNLQPVEQLPVITTVWRRYDNHAYIPSLAVRNHGLSTQLVGYDQKLDSVSWLTTSMYDYITPGTNYMEFCDQLRASMVIYDPFTFHSFSRTTIDTAAMGVPVVVSNRTQSGNVCYPYTAVDPYDVKSARELIQRLLVDKDFRELVISTAQERVEAYNHDNSRDNYLTGLYKSAMSGREVQERKIVKVRNGEPLPIETDVKSSDEGIEKRQKRVIKYGRGEKVLG